MINLISALSDAFTNPDSPWYYVIGVAFLLLVFGALAVYIVVSGKKRKAKEAKEAKERENAAQPTEAEANTTDVSSDAANNTQEPAPDEEKAENAEEVINDEAVTASEVTEAETPQETAIAEEKEEAADREPAPAEQETNEKDAKKSTKANAAEEEPKLVMVKKEPTAKKTAEPKPAPKKSNVIKIDVPEDEKKTEKKPATTATKKKTTTAKPFIDRLIAAKELHGVYNELKNTVLSYPGIKAKLSKENEVFSFGTDKKAAFELAVDAIVLKLYIDPATAPKQLGATASGDAELPTLLKVKHENIDNAQKLIVFAMNVALLTRNDKHRHTDYVKNAINAKAKAKAKK